jgi:hypothetical protein
MADSPTLGPLGQRLSKQTPALFAGYVRARLARLCEREQAERRADAAWQAVQRRVGRQGAAAVAALGRRAGA